MFDTFKLDAEEKRLLHEFIESVPEKYRRKNHLKIIFSDGSGIGIKVTAKIGKYEKDITDYSLW